MCVREMAVLAPKQAASHRLCLSEGAVVSHTVYKALYMFQPYTSNLALFSA